MKSILSKFFFSFLIVCGALSSINTVLAADNFCYCETDTTKLSQIADPTNPQKVTYWCSPKPLPVGECNTETAKKTLPQAQYLTCTGGRFKTDTDCQAEGKAWKERRDATLKALGKTGATGGVGTGLIFRAIPSCVFEDHLELSGECGSVNVFVTLLINLANAVFAIIGALALAAFIYGGFMLILSQGSPEKIKTGTDAMLAAFIGLAIAFGGYFLVRFLGEAIGLKEGFNLK